MKSRLTGALCAAVLIVNVLPCYAGPPPQLTVARVGDTDLTCDQLVHEAYVMRAIIERAAEERGDAKMRKTGINVAGAAAGLLVGTATGGIGIAAAGMLASRASDQVGDDADHVKDIAQQRRALMAGIFTAKACEGDISDAMKDPDLRDPLQRIAETAPAAGEQSPDYNP